MRSVHPEIRYAKSGDLSIAYQVVGDGPPDLVFVGGWVSHLECAWEMPAQMLFGRRLWSETRIALFEQAVDTRNPNVQRERSPRVTFGNAWVRHSVTELYREDITRFRTLVGIEPDEDPLAALRDGRVPSLQALRLHNGTVYRWVRACYGITDGKPHLRIENRVLPSGPSVVDEIANAALWLGLMTELMATYQDVTKVMEFEHAKHNFVAAARQGMAAAQLVERYPGIVACDMTGFGADGPGESQWLHRFFRSDYAAG